MQRISGWWISAVLLTLVFSCQNPASSGGSPTVKSSAKAVTSFTFASPAATGNINESNHTIAVMVPNGTSLTALAPTIVTSEKSTVTPASGAAKNFTSPVSYTVTAEDASTQAYLVTVTAAPATSKTITAFKFMTLSPAVTGTINETDHTVALTVPYGTNVSSLAPTITTTGKTVSPASGTTQNFSTPVTYTVTAQDTSTQAYVVTVTVAANPAKAITAFSFPALTISGAITESTHAIAVTVPYGTDVTALAPSLTITGASVSPASGTAVNFSGPVSYTVTAADSTTQAYTVTVTVAPLALAQWVQSHTTGNDGGFHGVVRDTSDGLYAFGFLNNSQVAYTFGTISVTPAAWTNNPAIVKYNTAGTPQWARTTVSAGTNTNDSGEFFSAVTDSTNNIYAAGSITYADTYGFGNDSSGNPVTAQGLATGNDPRNVLLVKYNSNGTPQWAKSVTASGAGASLGGSEFQGLATDTQGNLYAVGYVSNSAYNYDFGNGVTLQPPASYASVLLVKYNSSGLAQWAKTLTSGTSYSQFYGIAVDGSGNLYAAGTLSGSGTFNFGNSVTAAGPNTGTNPVLVKYDSSGIALWAKTSTGANGGANFSGVAVDSSGNVYVAGSTYGTTPVSFGAISVTGYFSGWNAVLVKYTSAGTASWVVTSTSGPSPTQWSTSFKGVSLDGSGNVYAIGQIGGGTVAYGFGNGVAVLGKGAQNFVLVKYNSAGSAQWAQSTFSGSTYSAFGGVAFDSSGNAYGAGDFTTGTIGVGNNLTATATSSQSQAALLIKYAAY